MNRATPDPEQFLAAFHDTHAGITSRAFSHLGVEASGRRFASSYECLAAEVPTTAGPRTVLDLGCGDGFLLSCLAAREQPDLSLIGVDISQGELEAARTRLGSAAVLLQGRAQRLALATGSVDHVVCHMALMLMDQVDTVLAEVRRVLKKGAAFAAVVNIRPPPSTIFDSYIALLSRFPRVERFDGLRFGDRRLRKPEGIRDVFGNGFDAVSVQPLQARRRCSPAALCRSFEDTYDFHMLDLNSQHAFNAGLIAAIEAQCEDDGKVEFSDPLCLITAVAA